MKFNLPDNILIFETCHGTFYGQKFFWKHSSEIIATVYYIVKLFHFFKHVDSAESVQDVIPQKVDSSRGMFQIIDTMIYKKKISCFIGYKSTIL